MTAIHWAHVDADGRIHRWGTALGSDVFAQVLLPGLTAVARPDHVTGFEPYRLVGGEWVKEEKPA